MCNSSKYNETFTCQNNDRNESIGGFFDISDPLFVQNAQIGMYAGLVIIPTGFILNFLCLIIFIKSKIVKTPTGLHLTFLALADNLVLMVLLVMDTQSWSRLINIPNLQASSTFMCSGAFLTVNVGFLWSGLLLVSATFERFLSVGFPLKIQQWNLHLKTKILMALYIIASVALSGFAVLCYDLEAVGNDTIECRYKQKHHNVCQVGNIVVNSVLSNGICSFLIFIFTILTSLSLHRYKRSRSKLAQNNLRNNEDRELQVTLMLVIVATLFLILRVPEMIVYQLMIYYSGNNIQSSVSQKTFAIYPLFAILVLINHSVNFFIHMKFLNSFRNACVDLFRYSKTPSISKKISSSRNCFSDLQTTISAQI